ncbi:MAG: ankyrin repeat domain-containing protein [Sulfurisoma sp.]|nr:ankyrin repeat domain-containing protein [Sulfurisoma sp.]
MDSARQPAPPARQRREWLLIGLVGLLALLANLPSAWIKSFGVDSRYVVAVLGLLVLLALFLYVRFFFFLLFSLLAIGANIPDQWAGALGIDRATLLATLSMMVAMSLLNYKMKLLPTGVEVTGSNGRTRSGQGLKALMTAVEKGHISNAGKILGMNIELDMRHASGHTPLTRAAELGDKAMVELLLRHGADASLANTAGLTAAELALKGGHTELYAILKPRLPDSTTGTDQESRLGE